MRTIIIGDIHGQYKAFVALLEKVHFSTAEDRLILLGDLMDRGPDSQEVLKKVISLSEEMGNRFVYIRGSHEKLLLDNSKKLKDRILWHIVGKDATVRSFRKHNDDMFAYADWIKEHSALYFEEPGFRCVHAAVKDYALADNDEYTLLMDHNLTKKNLYNGPLTITGHIHLKQPTYFDGTGVPGKVLPTEEILELPEKGIICLDTARPNGMKLIAMIIKDNTFHLSEFVK